MGGSLGVTQLLFNLYPLDARLFDAVNGITSLPWADALFLWLTAPPHRLLLFLALWGALFTLGGPRGRRVAWMALLVVAVTDQLSSSWIKPWADRVRPCFALPEARLLLTHQAGSASFPSSHAANTFSVAVLLFGVRPLLGYVGLLVAALVSLSRVWVGVHYPSDVLAGALLGVSIGLAANGLARWISGLRSRG